MKMISVLVLWVALGVVVYQSQALEEFCTVEVNSSSLLPLSSGNSSTFECPVGYFLTGLSRKDGKSRWTCHKLKPALNCSGITGPNVEIQYGENQCIAVKKLFGDSLVCPETYVMTSVTHQSCRAASCASSARCCPLKTGSFQIRIDRVDEYERNRCPEETPFIHRAGRRGSPFLLDCRSLKAACSYGINGAENNICSCAEGMLDAHPACQLPVNTTFVSEIHGESTPRMTLVAFSAAGGAVVVAFLMLLSARGFRNRKSRMTEQNGIDDSETSDYSIRSARKSDTNASLNLHENSHQDVNAFQEKQDPLSERENSSQHDEPCSEREYSSQQGKFSATSPALHSMIASTMEPDVDENGSSTVVDARSVASFDSAMEVSDEELLSDDANENGEYVVKPRAKHSF